MQLIEYQHGRLLAEVLESYMLRHRIRSSQDDPAVVDAIPIEIARPDTTTRRRLAHLTRSAYERHLSMPSEMVA
jgi:hypothetical protein